MIFTVKCRKKGPPQGVSGPRRPRKPVPSPDPVLPPSSTLCRSLLAVSTKKSCRTPLPPDPLSLLRFSSRNFYYTFLFKSTKGPSKPPQTAATASRSFSASICISHKARSGIFQTRKCPSQAESGISKRPPTARPAFPNANRPAKRPTTGRHPISSAVATRQPGLLRSCIYKPHAQPPDRCGGPPQGPGQIR